MTGKFQGETWLSTENYYNIGYFDKHDKKQLIDSRHLYKINCIKQYVQNNEKLILWCSQVTGWCGGSLCRPTIKCLGWYCKIIHIPSSRYFLQEIMLCLYNVFNKKRRKLIWSMVFCTVWLLCVHLRVFTKKTVKSLRFIFNKVCSTPEVWRHTMAASMWL